MKKEIIFSNHKEAIKGMKRLIDILKVFGDTDDCIPIYLDLSEDTPLIMAKYGNSYLENKCETIPEFISAFDKLEAVDTYEASHEDIIATKKLIAMSKKDFVEVYATMDDEEENLRLYVTIRHKESGTEETEVINFVNTYESLPDKFVTLKNNLISNHNPENVILVDNRDIISMNEGSPVEINIPNSNKVLCRIMKNALVRNFKIGGEYSPCIIYSMGKTDQTTALCMVSYGTSTDKMPEMELRQYFKVLIY